VTIRTDRQVNIRRQSIGLMILLATFLLRADVSAQSDSGIIGQVTDESGAVLPGVTVTATSPALQVPQVTAVTNEQGEYRLAPLPIGLYIVEYELSGFQSVRREELRLGVGFVARVDISLKVGGVEETITVTGAAAVVDVTSTANVTRLTRETLEIIPSSRNGLIGLLSQAPGVRMNLDVGGNSALTTPISRVFGQSGEAWTLMDGVLTTAPQSSSHAGNYWDYTVVEEAIVQSVAKDPSVPSRGVYLNTIVKAGSNEFHGENWLSWTNQALQGTNITDALRAQGIREGNRVETRYDVSGDLGGRIIRDKLWFYSALRRRGETSPVLEGGLRPDGTPAANVQLVVYKTDKLSYQLSQTNRLVGFHNVSLKNDQSGVSRFVPWESRTHNKTHTYTGKVEWQAVHSDSFVLTAHYGNWRYDVTKPNHAPDKSMTLDIATQQRSGPSTSAGEVPVNLRHEFKGTATLYRPNLFLGNHEFKTGLGYTHTENGRGRPESENLPREPYQLEFNNGVAFQLAVRNDPTVPKQISHYLDGYITDNWTIARRLTLDLGLRYAHDNGFVPAGCRDAARPPAHLFAPALCIEKRQFAIWNSLAPRLYAAYDLTGDGKTVLKGGWGRFAHVRVLNEEVGIADPSVQATARYRWRDLNGNRLYDAGEVNLDPNGPDFLQSTGGARGVPNPDEQLPTSDQLSLSIDRELFADFAVRAIGVYARSFNNPRRLNLLRPREVYNIPVVRPDPGSDGLIGTADDPGASFTYYEYPATLAGQRFERFMPVTDETIDQTFKSFEVAAFKRLSSRWQLSASYSATKKNIPLFGGTFDRPAVLEVNPNAEIFQSDRTWDRSARVSGAYIFPAEVLVSANLERRGGDPFSRQVLFTGGRTIPSIVLNVEPLGTRQLPTINLVDVRVQKTMRLPRGQRVIGRINVFNVMNTSTVTAVNVRSGSTFLRPSAIMPPRILEFGVSYAF